MTVADALRGRMAALEGEERRERGNILVMFLLTLLALLLVTGFAAEMGTVYGVQSTHDSDVAVARETTLASGFGMRLKSSDDPALETAREVCASLRANGCSGKVTVYWYEAGPRSAAWSSFAASAGAARTRAAAYCAVLDTEWKPAVFSESVFGGLHLTSKTSCSLTPYAPKETYKPADSASSYNTGRVQVVEFAAGTAADASEDKLARSTLPESDMASATASGTLRMLKAAVDDAVEQAEALW